MKKKGIRIYGISYKAIFALIPLCLYTFIPLLAQQIGIVNHSFYKPMLYNPAFTGDGDGANVLLIHRTQWADFKGAPQFNMLMLDKNFMHKKVGLGLELINDKKGINNRMEGNLFYSYRVNIGDNTHLSFGLSLGIIDQAVDYSKAVVENTTDVTLFSASQHKTTYDGNVGFVFVSKGLELGASAPHLFGNKINYIDNSNAHTYYAQARHYMGSLKYKFYLSKEKEISVAPLGLLRFIPNAPLQYDGNLTANWNNKFWIGATYHSEYAVAANVGFCIHKQFSVGYSYEIITGRIGQYSGISHEIMLNIKFGNTKKPEPPKPAAQDSVKTETKAPEIKPVRKESPKVETKKSETKSETKTENKFDYVAYRQHQLDSLEKLKLNPARKDKNQNSQALQYSDNKTMYKTVWIATNKILEFKDASNQSQTGYYVIVGSFLHRNNATNFVQHLIGEGFRSANWMYSSFTNYNYVFIKRLNTKEEAFKEANKAKVAGYDDVWIQLIIE
jgi:type IX secretion system PorP/SprF family membrane protein